MKNHLLEGSSDHNDLGLPNEIKSDTFIKEHNNSHYLIREDNKQYQNFSNNFSEYYAYIVCAFYTERYAEEVKKLKDSLEYFKIPYVITFFESRGYWEANTRIKPEYLLSCLQNYPQKDIVYLDADAIVRAPLLLFENYTSDVGVFYAPDNGDYSHNYLTGTLYLKNNRAVHEFVMEWVNSQQSDLLCVDQDSFERAVQKCKNLSIEPLPGSYVKIYDRAMGSPVIEHFQASRKHTKLQKIVKRGRNCIVFIAVVVLVYFIYL